MQLSPEHTMIRDALRSFAQERLAPNAARWDKEHHFPQDELRGLAELGAYGVAVPEELGGAGLDYLALALVIEEIAAGDGGTSTVISVNNCPVCSIGMMYANAAQKEQWLRPLAGQFNIYYRRGADQPEYIPDFVAATDGFVTVDHRGGLAAAADAFLTTVKGAADPAIGIVVRP